MAEGLQGGIGAISLLGATPTITTIPANANAGMTTVAPVNALAKGGKKKFTEEELNKFGNFAGTTDTKDVAKYLMGKGLIGASQLYTDSPNVATKEGIVNSQSDWKPSAISHMLMQAKSLGIKSPESVTANKAALMASMPPRLKEALNNPAFMQIHPNFWNVFKDILQDQYKKEGI